MQIRIHRSQPKSYRAAIERTACFPWRIRVAVQAMAGVAGLIAMVGLTTAGPSAERAAAIANPDTCETAHAALDGTESAMIEAINAERAIAGLPPYLISAKLSQAAAWLAEDLATSGAFSHTDSKGRGPAQRGLDCVGVSMAENLAGGYFGSPASVVDAWMGSPGHRANILNASYLSIGVGRYGSVWAVDFSLSRLDGTGSPATAPPAPGPTETPIPTRTTSPTPTAAPTSTPTRVPMGSRQLYAGVNLLTYAGPPQPMAAGLGAIERNVQGVYRWDPAEERWLRYFPGKPEYINTLSWIEPGAAYFFLMSDSTAWVY